MRQLLQSVPRMALWAAYACLVCRLLVPVGYMPAPLSEGGPFVLCHGGYQGELIRYLSSGNNEHSAHAAHAAVNGGADDELSHDSWSYCSISASSASVTLTTFQPPLPLAYAPYTPDAAPVKPLLTVAPPPRQSIRAPPSTLSV